MAQKDCGGFFVKAIALAGLTSIALLGACASTPTSQEGAIPGLVDELPEAVAAIVDTEQDVSVVRISPEDGCYWYQWAGPVETTFLPLRTFDGRMICTRTEEQADEAG